MEFTHSRFGAATVKELTQRDVEAFFGGINEAVDKMVKVQYDGAALRLAFSLGLFVFPLAKPEEVDGMAPNRVRWLSDCLGAALSDALTVDPLS